MLMRQAQPATARPGRASPAASRPRPRRSSRRPNGGALRPVEIADAGVFAALAVVIVSVGTFLPHLGVLQLLGAVPFGIVGLRNRVRAVLAATVAAAFVAFLVAGLVAAVIIATCALLGGLCGVIRRRGRGYGTVVLAAVVLGPAAAAVTVGLMTLFARARELAFGSLRASAAGLVRLAGSVGLPPSAGHAVLSFTDTLLGSWQIVFAAAVGLAVPAWMLLTNLLVVLVARRVERLAHTDPLDHAARDDAARARAGGVTGGRERPGPVPLRLAGVGFGYPAAGQEALTDIDLTVAAGEFVAVVGPNGAGKSTLVSLLAGAEPARGQVHRPGRVGLGEPGGTAIVGQRAETQVIGSTVGEDLRWGLPPGYPVDVEGLLGWVGLDGLAGASTEALSGGQLQRLAIATAMARQPALLISDESTSMLDAAGRAEVLELLAALPARTGTAVVHVTHDPAEAARADRVIGLAGGRVADPAAADELAGPAGPRVPPRPVPAAAAEPGTAPVIRVRGARHRYDAGTPWEVTALRSVDLDVYPGEGLLVTGGNGSGKSTLAWLLAGLVRPTEGTVTVDGVPAHQAVGAVALSFQHARLQLQRPTVAQDILAAAGPNRPAEPGQAADFVRGALERVGLPAELGGRAIDALSGGQMRRVAIAGLLASRPRLLILDEPLAGLDRASRRGLLELLGRMRRDDGLTLVVISHDFEDMELACTRSVEVTDGTARLPGPPPATAPPPADLPPPRRRRGRLVLRALPGRSPLHRVDAAVKLLVLAAATIVSLLLPGWPAVGVLAALLAAGAVAARLPATVLPRVSWWVVAVLAAGAVAAAAGHGLVLYAQSLLLTALFLALSLLVVWTTRVEELPAAFTRLARPLRVVRAPVDEWAHAVTFTVRTLPLLSDELRVLVAGRRLRGQPATRRRARPAARGREALDLVVAVVASAARRASDLGRAATQRGGMRAS